ncbi:pantetheine-phosphate adenylyltransferase [Clostridium formicaceticum]|uniref:Phosphopantetheine adenylyltransferase n=1 Tax=Clostridium formicaceticum TaxID=1497 RepID=A0AAC9RIV9_9CLOT|nr:pantetheine-phosphate adenylyltransferase [Clostridium formicaceticum]AOY77359.1 pantetheine-phosphate adenylyltransferase [Clostridium formicaceticum]ARE87904.1 Phosphopantetheine adenylyltransferase [Clostridium formicaceticum]
MKTGIYPGSFDPITNGHLDIIERASKLCDKVIVSVLQNPNKNSLFSLEERVTLIKEAVAAYKNVTVDCFSGLLIDYVKKNDAKVIIKGLRAVSDFEYEFQMALMNRKLAPDVETIFLMTSSENSYLSSSLVKEVAKFGGCIEGLVPESTKKAIFQKI